MKASVGVAVTGAPAAYGPSGILLNQPLCQTFTEGIDAFDTPPAGGALLGGAFGNEASPVGDRKAQSRLRPLARPRAVTGA